MWKVFRAIEIVLNHIFSNILLRVTGIRCPFSSVIYFPIRVINSKNITIGKHVDIYKDCYFWTNSFESNLIIKDRAQIGAFSHITAMKTIVIGENAIIADRVFITDFNHEFNDVTLPIRDQGISFIGVVEIGKNSWVGENVSIIGAKIGKNSVIGSNSVVLSDIPDYSIAVGNPARIVKKFDFELNKWVKV